MVREALPGFLAPTISGVHAERVIATKENTTPKRNEIPPARLAILFKRLSADADIKPLFSILTLIGDPAVKNEEKALL